MESRYNPIQFGRGGEGGGGLVRLCCFSASQGGHCDDGTGAYVEW